MIFTGTSAPEVPTLVLESNDRAPSAARRFVAEWFRKWEMDDADARVVMSELVTNAHRHGAGAIVVRLWLGERGGPPVLEVWDEGEERPVVRAESHAALDGRGMRIIEELAETWGVRGLVEGGKVVWVRLRR